MYNITIICGQYTKDCSICIKVPNNTMSTPLLGTKLHTFGQVLNIFDKGRSSLKYNNMNLLKLPGESQTG